MSAVITNRNVTILANPVVAKLHEPSQDLRLLVSELLSYKVDGAEFSGNQHWDGYASLYQMRSNTFPAGFVRLIKRKLELAGYRVMLRTKQAPEPTGPERPVVDSFGEDPRYDYQLQTMERLVELKRMIAQVATGGGKSRIFKLCEARLNLPTLFITTRKTLMYQMAEDYERSTGNAAGILGDGVWTPRPDGVNFAIVDTLTSRLDVNSIQKEVDVQVNRWHRKIQKKITDTLKAAGLPYTKEGMYEATPKQQKAALAIKKRILSANPVDRDVIAEKLQEKLGAQEARRVETVNFLQHVGFLCLEEAHEVSAGGYYSISNACKNAHYRLALTATPFMKDDQEANMRLMAVTGPIGIRVSEKLLIDRGILAKPYFKYLKSKCPEKLTRHAAWSTAYKLGIVENQHRNELIRTEVARAKMYGLPAMVLIQLTKHGHTLEKMLTDWNIRTAFIYGKHEQEARASALFDLKSGKIDALIGSTILDVGVDVPAVGLIVLAGGGKAEVSLRQRVGRGLRAKKSGPNVAFVVDFEDRFNKHLVKHYRERRRIIEDTPGFAENIVGDFDFRGCGLEPLKS